jgi:ATP-dependent helicase/DNAse subunit B
MTDTTLLSVEVPQKTKSDKQLQEFENAKELFSKLFIKTEDWKSLADYIINILNQTSSQYNSDNAEDNDNNTEHRRVAIEEISKLKNLVEDCNIPLTTETFISLLRRHLQAKTISYEGKPLDGIQVLGILETRNLDFENVIILSMTDANFPGNHTNQASLIPYNLRYAYEMPTPEQHEAMYAYYFYRLLQRAKRVHMLYCSCANEKSTGECSRYIYQLDFEYGGIEKRSLGVDLSIGETSAIEVKKDDNIMEALMQYTGRRDQNAKDKLPTFSPTALFRYVECPLKFYFASIAKLHLLNEFDDKIDSLTLGKIIHKSMENLYERHKIVGMRNPKESIEALRKDSIIKPIVDEAIGEILYNNANTTTKDYTGDTLLVRDIIIKYIKDGILAHDAKRDDYTVSGLEKEIKCGFMTSKGVIVNFQGIADRIDTLADGTKQIIDYKSGYKPHLEFNGFDNLFNGNNEQRISNIFQTLLYSMIVNRSENVDVKPSLFYAACMVDNLDYSPYIWIIEKEGHNIIERYTQVSKQFEEKLRGVLDELFDQEKPFTQVGDKKFCKLCDYNKICKRDDPS